MKRLRAMFGLILEAIGYAESGTPCPAFLTNDEIDRRF